MNVAPLPLFHAFTAPHLGAVAAITLVISALVAWGRRLPPPRAEQAGRAIGVLLIAYYLVEAAIRVQVLHVGAIEMLPFDLCSALFFLGAWAFWSGSPLAFEVIFFWTFAGTLHSLITPTPHAGFPDLNYFQYFTAHGLLMVSATYSAVVLRHTPKQGSMWR